MNGESRTLRSVKNIRIALLFYFFYLILNFFSRKIFLEYLGAEVLGLNTTAQNLLGFLNLAELGVGAAVSYMLYRPLFDGNRQEINEIVSVQGWIYRRIAWVVIAGACVLMLFFPLIFRKAELPLWYAYGSFVVLLTGALLSYFVNYRQIVLEADQKGYWVTLCVQGVKLVKIVLQILAIRYLEHGYVYWLGIEFVMAIVTSVALNKVLKREYSWLEAHPSRGKILMSKYPDIFRKTKQVFFHRIGLFVQMQVSPLIIYAYTTLTVVAAYGNYMLIVSGVGLLMGSLLNGVNAGVGNLVAEGNRGAIKSFFWELTSFRTWAASLICFGIYKLTHSFICLWIGEEFLLDQSAFVMLVLYSFLSLSRTNDVFLSAYGLFQDVWAPVTEACLNVGCSVLLGYFWGLPGILAGVVISMLLIVCGWKPYFLYRNGFKEKIAEYVIRQIKYLLLIAGAWISSVLLLDVMSAGVRIESYVDWITYAVQVFVVNAAVSLPLFYVLDKGIRDFIGRVGRIVLYKTVR